MILVNAFSAFADGDPNLLPVIEKEPGLALPVIVLGEYLYGIHRSRFRVRYQRWLHANLSLFELLAVGSTAGLFLGILASRVLAFVVYQATPRDPLVLVGVVLAMALLGLLATWIPARRALSVNPMILLREE